MPIVSVGQITIVDVNDGLDGPALQIVSSAAGFTYQDGVASPADQTISFTLLRQGLDNTEANWAASGATLGTNKDRIDITEYIFGLPGTGDGDTAYLTLAQFGTARQMSIGATVGSLAAYANVSRIGESTAEAGATRNILSGNWTTATAYGVGDIVVSSGFRWICILAHISSGSVMPPVFPATSNLYWRLEGARGALTTSRAIAGSTWVDADAATAIANAGGVSPIQGDVVTLFNTTAGYSETRIRSSAGSWTALSVIFGGNVIVDNTLTASKIQANTITASKLLVADFSNMAQDPMMVDNASWLSVGGAAWTTWGTSATEDSAFRSTRFMKITGASGSYAGFHYSKWMPVEPGQSYYVTAQGRSVGGVASGAQYNLEWAEDENRTGFVETDFTATGSNTPVDVARTVTAPAGKRFMRVRFFKQNNTATEVRWGGLIVRRRASGELIVDGSISTDKLAANAVTAAKIAANTITASQIAAGAIGASQIAAGAVTTDKLLVTGRGKALNDDPTFQDSSAWVQGAGSGTFVLVAESSSPSGSNILRGTGAVQFRARRFPIAAGTRYKVSMWARMTAGSGAMYLRLYCNNAADATVNYLVSSTAGGTLEGVSVPAAWTKYTGFIDAGVATVNAYLIVHVNWQSTGTTDVADCRVEEYIGADLIVDGAVSAAKIAAGAVTTAKLDAAAVTADKVAANSISAAAIQSGAITTAKLAAGAVTANEIAAATITGGQIAAGTITGSNIAADTITAGQIAAGAVTSSEVAAGAITTAKLAASAVTANEITAGAITTAKLAAGAVTANELSANSVVAGKIATGAVNAAQIAAGAITTDKLLVTGRGAALNEDPGCQDPTAWQNGGHGDTASQVTISDGIAGSYAFRSTTGTASSIDTAKLYPVSSGKRYRLSAWVRRSSNANGVLYLRLVDQVGNQLTQFYEAATPSTTWVRLAAEFVPTTSQTSVRIRLILNWTGSAGYHEATDIRLEEKAEGDLIVDGTIAASKIAAGTLTADKMVSGLLSADNVLTRGLTVRDNSGNVLFGVGTNLDWGRISNQPSGIYNSSITISGGAIQGIGSGAGTAVANANIFIGSNGALSGAGGGQVTIGGLGYSGELNATYGAVAGANLRDSNGRTVSDVRLLGNLLDSTAWAPDTTGSQTGFPENGTSSGGLNYIAYDSLPDGSRGVLWRARSGSAAGSSSEGGWNSTSFNVVSTKMYRFSVWIRCFGANASGSFYLGVGSGTVSDIGGGINYNPYFLANGRSLLPDSQWVLVVGYVYPSSYGGTQYNRGGVYRGSDGVKILDGTDFKWVAGTTSSYHRTYQYYTNQANNYQDFWNPRVDLVDGTEPSIAELLSMGSVSARNPITAGTASNYIANDAISITQLGTTLQTTNYSSTDGWQITKSGSATFNNASIRGAINGGSYTGWAWPAAGTWGFHLGPNGLLLGNANNGRYFQVTYDGQIYAPGFQIVNGSATFSGTLSGAIVNTDQIVGNAASTPYTTTSAGASASITVVVPNNASALLIQYYLGPDTYTYTGGGGKGDPGGYVQGPVLTGLTYDGSTTNVIVVGPTAGSHTVTVTRSYYTGTMRLSVLVLKR